MFRLVGLASHATLCVLYLKIAASIACQLHGRMMGERNNAQDLGLCLHAFLVFVSVNKVGRVDFLCLHGKC